MSSRALCLLLFALACGDDSRPADSGTPQDAGTDQARDRGVDRPDGASEDAAADRGAADSDEADAALQDTGADGSEDTGAPDAGTDSGTADSGRPDGCASDGDCEDGRCFLFPDGVRDCVEDPGPPPRNPCELGGLGDCECMEDTECTMGAGGRCIAFRDRYCGGVAPPPTNLCRYEGCSEDADCTEGNNGTCLPAGIGGFVARCIYGPCRTSADCRPGGVCDFFDNGCGSSGEHFCRYPDDVCSDTRPCRSGGLMPMACVPNPDGQGTQCVLDVPPA